MSKLAIFHPRVPRKALKPVSPTPDPSLVVSELSAYRVMRERQ